ncbi:MAG: ATP-binding protein [Syntrophobacteraceae bacterium]
MTEDCKPQILREQIRLGIEQLPAVQGASLVAALVLCYAVRDSVPHANLFVWAALVLLMSIGRMVFCFRFSKVRADSFAGEPWRRAYLILSVISGVIWGLSAFIIFPAGDPILISFYILVLGGVVAGTAMAHSSIKFASAAGSMPAAVCYWIRLVMEGGELGFTVGLLMILYMLSILGHAIKHNRFIASAIALRFENVELLDQVRRANDSLRQEIAEHRIAQETLRDSEEKFRLAFQTAPDSINLNRVSDGMYLDINEGFTKNLGFTCDEVVGKTSLELDIWHDPKDREHMVASLRDTGFVENFEGKFRRKDGKTIIGLVSARILHINQEDVILSITRDITESKRAEKERKRLEEHLQRAEKMEALGTLAGGVAHDLNNVLGIVVGYSELLFHTPEMPSSIGSKADNILKASQKAAAIVQDLLTLARRGTQDRKPLNLNSVLMESQGSPEFTKLLSYHPNVIVKADLEMNLRNISCSSVHLEKSFMNLVANAMEAMPDGGTLTVRTGNRYLDKPVSGYDTVMEGDYVVLSVSDTGEGIPAGDQKRIFEPFYTRKVMGRSGTGLGLAVVWGTVKDHHGYINVESGEGQGTTITIYFPVTREGITLEQVSVPAAGYMGKGESILIVDDMKEQRELAAEMLRKLNYKPTTVTSGEEGVEYLSKHTIDLVILDMLMDPGMDGLDTYSKILEIHPEQKAIIVSGFSESERVGKAQALGAGAYLRKPYVLLKLGLAVRNELDRRDNRDGS